MVAVLTRKRHFYEISSPTSLPPSPPRISSASATLQMSTGNAPELLRHSAPSQGPEEPLAGVGSPVPRICHPNTKLVDEKVSAVPITSGENGEVQKDSPFAPLTEEDESFVRSSLQLSASCLPRDVLVVHEKSNIQITRRTLQCLRNRAWLNDEVINLYLELLHERENGNPNRCFKCHFFNTFFYKKLTAGGDGYDFNAVRRWTTQRRIEYSLLDRDRIFVPILKDKHWSLAVIDVEKRKFLYLDSLGKKDGGVLNVLGRYFADEVRDKSNETIDVRLWKQEFVANLPLQKNLCDCGLFTIKYVDFLSRGSLLSFHQGHMEYFRKRTAKEILRLKAD